MATKATEDVSPGDVPDEGVATEDIGDEGVAPGDVPVVGVSDREMKQRCSVRFCQQLLSKIICNGTLVQWYWVHWCIGTMVLGTLVYWYNGTGYNGVVYIILVFQIPLS